jgi:hypothetical protein
VYIGLPSTGSSWGKHVRLSSVAGHMPAAECWFVVRQIAPLCELVVWGWEMPCHTRHEAYGMPGAVGLHGTDLKERPPWVGLHTGSKQRCTVPEISSLQAP